MKKKLIEGISFDRERVRKIWMTMRLIVFLFFISLIHASASVYSQKTKLNVKLENASLTDVFKVLQEQSEFDFFYKNEQIPADSKVSIEFKNENIEVILDEILNGTGLTYHVLDKDIVITTNQGAKGELSVQQQKSVTGKVTDSSGGTLPGVSVVVKGTTSGTITDANGNYSVKVPENATLQFSFVGMKTQEIAVGNQTSINIVLEEDFIGIDEVVAVGYGTANRRNITGNQSVVKNESLTPITTSSIDATLQGKATGLDISSTEGGRSNGLVRVRIRGNGSINSGTQPLWIVDGIPVNADEGGTGGQLHNNYALNSSTINYMADLNPNDIESVSVLKDAASTAIYGSRGANGVILITTKTGKAGKGKIDFEYKRTFNQAINQVKLMNGEQWRNANSQAWKNDGMAGQFPVPVVNLFLDTLQNGSSALSRELMNSTNTDWLEKSFRTGIADEISLSTSNGTEKASYYISGQYISSEGIMIGQDNKKFNIRSNIDFQPLKWLKIGVKSTFSTSHGYDVPIEFDGSQRGYYTQAGSFGTPSYQGLMMKTLPVYPERYADGSPFEPLGGLNAPLILNDRNKYSQEYNINHIVGMTYFEIELMKGLSFRTEAGLDFYGQPYHTYAGGSTKGAPNVWATTNYAIEGLNQTRRTNYNGVLSYSNVFADIHNINVTIGAEQTSTSYYYNRFADWNITTPNHRLGENTYAANNPDLYGLNGITNEYEERFSGYFGRINYALANKYLIGFSIRRDGSNKFGPDNQFGIFPSLSSGWILSDEDFFPKNTFNLLKLRASIGETGNSNIPLDRWKTSYGDYGDYNEPPDKNMIVLGNSGIRWEKSKIFDTGLEFGLLENRISGSVAYYNKTTTDMLLNASPAPSIPAGVDPTNRFLITNAGSLLNSGVELSVSTVNINSGDFKWSSDINFSTNSNKIKSLSTLYASTPFQISGDQRIAIAEGHILGEYVLTQFAGYTDQGDDKIYKVDQDKKLSSNTFDLVRQGNETLISTVSNYADNRFYTGKSGIPKFFGGINNSFTYKGLSLDVFFTFKGGHYVYLNQARMTSPGTNNMTEELLDNTWTPTNTNSSYPRLSYNGLTSELDEAGNIFRNPRVEAEDRYLIKGDYLRLKNIRLAYSLPKFIIDKYKVKNLMIYADVQNLLTFSKLKYYDPEITGSLRGAVSGNGGSNTASAFNYAPSVISSVPFPNVRTFTFGIKMGL